MNALARLLATSVVPIASGLSGCAAPLAGSNDPPAETSATVNRQSVEEALARWREGRGSFYDLLADDATITIVGHTPHSGTFDKATFLREIARPFLARFRSPILPSGWRVWSAEDQVIVRWESRATACDGQPYTNRYAYFLTVKDGRAVALTMFLDTGAFEEVWNRCSPVADPVVHATLPAPSCSVKIWRLDCGSFSAPRSHFSDLFSRNGERGSYVDSCYLIRHGSDLMLWDAGLPLALRGKPEDLASPVRMKLSVSIADQLQRLGFTTRDVTLVGISHNHSDHTGQAASFPEARLLMDKTDFSALAQSPPPFFTEPSTLQPWLAGSGAKELVTGDHDVFGDGAVVMVALPGHTAGNHGLLVRLAQRGTILLSGDTLHSPDQLTSHELPPSNPSRSDSLASLDRIEDIVRDAHATLIVQHDSASVAKLPLFPAGAE